MEELALQARLVQEEAERELMDLAEGPMEEDVEENMEPRQMKNLCYTMVK